MNKTEETRLIREAVKNTCHDAKITWPPTAVGPVPMGNLLDELPTVTHREVDGLNRAAASATLLRWGVQWSEIPHDDPALAGFIFANSRRGFIFVRRGDNLTRRRFTVAHELGHYRLHLTPEIDRGAVQLIQVDREEDIRESDQADLAVMERQANRFAAELLMPEAVCRILFERYARRYGTIERLLTQHLAADLLVSRSAIAWRLYDLDLIDRPTWLGHSGVGQQPGSAPIAEVV